MFNHKRLDCPSHSEGEQKMLKLEIIKRLFKGSYPTEVQKGEKTFLEEKEELLRLAREKGTKSWRLNFSDGTTLWDRLTPEERWDLLSEYEKKYYPNPPTGRYGKSILSSVLSKAVYEGENICMLCGGEFLHTHTVVEDDKWGHKGKAHKECRENELAAADLLGI